MPIYAYRCEACGHAKDVLQKFSDPLLTICPSCGAEAFKKQVTAAGFQLKGSGWYVTDFRGDSNGAKTSAEAVSTAATKGEGANGSADKSDAGKADSAKAEPSAKDSAKSDSAGAKSTTSSTATPASGSGAGGSGSPVGGQ
jgi:putative FmdB family regulatory protein